MTERELDLADFDAFITFAEANARAWETRAAFAQRFPQSTTQVVDSWRCQGELSRGEVAMLKRVRGYLSDA